MTATVAGTGDASVFAPASKRWRYGWLVEVGVMAGLFQLYELGRELVAGGTAAAFANAEGIVDAQRWLGILWERSIQQAFLDTDWFITFWNWFYGTVHFLLPAAALVFLYRRAPARYLRWRNTLLAMWAIGVLVFWLYPLMPPRLMPPGYGCAGSKPCVVDTAVGYTNLGPRRELEFNRDGTPTKATLDQYANPYAAMPSFHIGWSTFTAAALWSFLRRHWMKVAMVAYLLAVIFCITVTGNHWLLDVPGGWAVVAAGLGVALVVERVWLRVRARPASASVGVG